MRSYAELFSGKKDEIAPELGSALKEAYLYNDLMEDDQFCRITDQAQADAHHAE